jgi:hypothetical protein
MYILFFFVLNTYFVNNMKLWILMTPDKIRKKSLQNAVVIHSYERGLITGIDFSNVGLVALFFCLQHHDISAEMYYF